MEFENLQIEIPTEEDSIDHLDKTFNPATEKKYHNTSKGFVVGLDLSSKEAIRRKENRAKRFGVGSTETKKIGYIDPFVEVDLINIEFPQVTDAAFAAKRPESLHLYGVGNMNTEDVFEYFIDHGPDTLEWIDDHSCNVVWETENMAKTAMTAMSRTYDELKEIGNATIPSESSDEEARYIWRVGKPHMKAKYLFLRQTTVEDRKLPGAAKRSLYYLIHGRGRKARGGIVSSSRKRRMEQADNFLREKLKSRNPEVQFLSVNEGKKPNDELDQIMDIDADNCPVPTKRSKEYSGRGKMYSDLFPDKDVASRVSKEENLRIEVSNTTSKWTSNKKNQHKRDGSGSNNDSDDDDSDDDVSINESIDNEVNERDPSVKCDDEDLREQINSTDLRTKIERNSQKNVQDLRTKLQQKKKHLGFDKEQLNLCIEVTEISDED